MRSRKLEKLTNFMYKNKTKFGLPLLRLTSSLTLFSLILPWEFLQKIMLKPFTIMRYALFFISNTFTNKPRLKLAKN